MQQKSKRRRFFKNGKRVSGSDLGILVPTRNVCQLFFDIKKIGGNLSKIQTLEFEKGVINVLSKKVKIIFLRQVQPDIGYPKPGKRKRLFKSVESYFPDSKY